MCSHSKRWVGFLVGANTVAKLYATHTVRSLVWYSFVYSALMTWYLLLFSPSLSPPSLSLSSLPFRGFLLIQVLLPVTQAPLILIRQPASITRTGLVHNHPWQEPVTSISCSSSSSSSSSSTVVLRDTDLLLLVVPHPLEVDPMWRAQQWWKMHRTWLVRL